MARYGRDPLEQLLDGTTAPESLTVDDLKFFRDELVDAGFALRSEESGYPARWVNRYLRVAAETLTKVEAVLQARGVAL